MPMVCSILPREERASVGESLTGGRRRIGDEESKRVGTGSDGLLREGVRQHRAVCMAAVKSGSKSQTARARAREAMATKLAEQREREQRVQDAAARFFAASDAIDTARLDAGRALRDLLDEGETRSGVAELLGVSSREIKQTLDALDGNDDTAESTSDETPSDDAGAANEPSPAGDA